MEESINDPGKDPIPRIFVVGMNKTGTSTMKGCFQELGWLPVASPKTIGGIRKRFTDITERNDYESTLDLVPDFLTFEDRPWNVWELYQHAARRFPAAKFILTRREPGPWWRSVENWLTQKKPELIETYSVHLRSEAFTERDFISGYERHNEAITGFFEGTDRLLTVDVTQGGRWEEICHFLGEPVPDAPFPHRNKQKYKL